MHKYPKKILPIIKSLQTAYNKVFFEASVKISVIEYEN